MIDVFAERLREQASDKGFGVTSVLGINFSSPPPKKEELEVEETKAEEMKNKINSKQVIGKYVFFIVSRKQANETRIN